jgi:hypothetical protein
MGWNGARSSLFRITWLIAEGMVQIQAQGFPPCFVKYKIRIWILIEEGSMTESRAPQMWAWMDMPHRAYWNTDAGSTPRVLNSPMGLGCGWEFTFLTQLMPMLRLRGHILRASGTGNSWSPMEMDSWVTCYVILVNSTLLSLSFLLCIMVSTSNS